MCLENSNSRLLFNKIKYFNQRSRQTELFVIRYLLVNVDFFFAKQYT